MKRPSFNLTGALLSLGLAAATLTSQAQTPPAQTPAPSPANSLSAGQVTKDFSLPQYQDGKLNAMISGSEARVISINRTEITNLKIDLYEDGQVSTTIVSPKSDFWSADNKMRTRYGVTITRPDMTITAQTMEWEMKEKRGVLRQDVKVVLNTLDLAQPAESPSPAATRPLTESSTVTPEAIPPDSSSLLLQPSAPADPSSPTPLAP